MLGEAEMEQYEEAKQKEEVSEVKVITKKQSHKTNGTFAVEIRVEGLPTAKMRDDLTKALEHGILSFFNEDEEVKIDANK